MAFLAQLVDCAADQGAVLREVTEPIDRQTLAIAIRTARSSTTTPSLRSRAEDVDRPCGGRRAGRGACRRDPGAGVAGRSPSRRFAGGDLVVDADQVDGAAPVDVSGGPPDAATVLVLGTSSDDRLPHLRAGEAVNAVLLRAVFHSMAGNVVADWLFMIGLLGIGLALVLGIGVRVAAVAGAVLLMAMWVASWPMATLNAAGEPTSSTNPLIDDHLVNAVLVVALAVYAAGDTWGFGRPWARLPLVRRNSWLR